MKILRLNSAIAALHPANHGTKPSDGLKDLVSRNGTLSHRDLWSLWTSDKPLAMAWARMNEFERLWWAAEVTCAKEAIR
jgi:hypothetical protein